MQQIGAGPVHGKATVRESGVLLADFDAAVLLLALDPHAVAMRTSTATAKTTRLNFANPPPCCPPCLALTSWALF
jgi:hypothetical protein